MLARQFLQEMPNPWFSMTKVYSPRNETHPEGDEKPRRKLEAQQESKYFVCLELIVEYKWKTFTVLESIVHLANIWGINNGVFLLEMNVFPPCFRLVHRCAS
jgi:hypothetical protein